ncbi:MAG: YgiQ family radical SAM protein [Bacteroidales bacterium]|nr:YgiQ family radical SAM protein [Bacteroidales bacterium]
MLSEKYNITDWLPTTKKEVEKQGWDELDVIIISGDAYVDHPSFGHAVIGRIIQDCGYRVAIIPQPNWRDDLRDFKKLCKPRLFFGVTAGCMDSMINHYTANKRIRSDDAYSPGGKAGFRPDYASVVYSNILKKLYPDTPVVLGGIESSLRRFTHYDYWSDKLKPSILFDSKADILIYGMGELPIVKLLKYLDKGVPVSSIKNLPQTAFLLNNNDKIYKDKQWESFELHSHEQCLKNKKLFAENFKHIEQESNRLIAKQLIQRIGNKVLVVNPPESLMTEKEIDRFFDLPFTRLPHPKYKKRGAIPAYEMIKHSVNIHRGCFGGCAFCTISAHQGRSIISRSQKSILKEVKKITNMPDFKGYISDLGGPSANMYKLEPIDISICKKCKRPSCIFPSVCKNLNTNHKPLIELYKKVSSLPEIKKLFISSGVRYDILLDKNSKKSDYHKEYIKELILKHVPGRLKVAPEHSSDNVLKIIRKPSFKLFKEFKKIFDDISAKGKLNQQLIPYLISSHPGCKLEDMADLAIETKKLGYRLKQVQDFTPTPMTLSTVIYYSGYNPYTMEKVYTAKSKKERLNQRKFFFWYKKENYYWVKNALKQMSKNGYIKESSINSFLSRNK